MAELTIAEAAKALGVSPETLRRRARNGEIPARKGARGRYIVEIDDAALEQAARSSNGSSPSVDAAEIVRLHRELDRAQSEVQHRDRLIDEMRRRADRAEQEADRLAQQLAAATVRELQVLAQNDLYELTSGSLALDEMGGDIAEAAQGVERANAEQQQPARTKRWWQFWRRASGEPSPAN